MAAPAKAMHLDLFGNPIDDGPPLPRLMPLEFEDSTLRMIVIKGQAWWVLSDLAKLLEYRDASHAARQLRPHHLGYTVVCTPGGEQKVKIASAGGLYRLVMRCDNPKAERFQDWVTDDVIPTIQKTGTYSGGFNDRISRKAKQLRCDRETAKERCDVIDANKSNHARLASSGAVPRDFKAFNNAAYRGQFGMEAPALRTALGLKKGRTPLDRMAPLLLSQHKHAKLLADKIARESGAPLSIDDQCLYVEAIAKEIVEADMGRLGQGFVFAVKDDDDRGRVLDIIRGIAS